MNLLGRVEPDLATRYLDVTLTDLKREFQLARSQPLHLTPQPKQSSSFEPASPACSTCRRWSAARCQPALPAPRSTGHPTGSQKSQRHKAPGPTESPASAENGRKTRHPTGIRGASGTSKQDLN